MAEILFNSKKITFNDLKDGKFPIGLNEYEQRTFQFCYEWLNNKKEFILTTSGSTGKPKDIIIEADKMKLSAKMTLKALSLAKGDRSLICLNTDFIAGKMMLVRSMIGEMSINIQAPTSNPLANISTESTFDFTALVPLQIETILKETPEKKVILDNMKGILIGGTSISDTQEALMHNIKAPLFHTFGMTETLSHIALRRINGKEKQDYFQVLDNIKISVDERSCLIIHSPFSEVPIRTNDIIKLISPDKFIWQGRADFVINTGGVKIHPEKVEKKIEKIFMDMKLPNRFFLYGAPDDKLGQKMSLLIEGDEPDTPIIDKISNQLSIQLDKYEKPKQIIFIPKFQETATGKISRLNTINSLNF